MANDDRDELIREMKRIAQELGSESVPRHEFVRRSGVSERRVQILFGSYNGLVEAAGLIPRSFPTADNPSYSDEYILEEVIRVLKLPQSKLTRIFFEQNSKVSASACERRFGGWFNALKTISTLLKPEEDSELIRRINEYAAPTVTASRAPAEESQSELSDAEAGGDHPGHALVDQPSRNLYGDFINFRGLQHCPVNEQGVVFLFGMVCRELGYVVEIVKSGFPDCEAKRRVRGKSGMWQRVRIEFEYQSRNFRAHGHDPDQCDVIVCWEDNWPDCPVEVLELKSELARLSSQIQPE